MKVGMRNVIASFHPEGGECIVDDARVGPSGTYQRIYLTGSILEVVLQKSTPPQIRQPFLYYY